MPYNTCVPPLSSRPPSSSSPRPVVILVVVVVVTGVRQLPRTGHIPTEPHLYASTYPSLSRKPSIRNMLAATCPTEIQVYQRGLALCIRFVTHSLEGSRRKTRVREQGYMAAFGEKKVSSMTKAFRIERERFVDIRGRLIFQRIAVATSTTARARFERDIWLFKWAIENSWFCSFKITFAERNETKGFE